MSGAALTSFGWRFNIAFPFLPTGLEGPLREGGPELQKAREFPARR
jgi:hypothetical protein